MSVEDPDVDDFLEDEDEAVELTAWESVPAFIRFAAWLVAILVVLWVLVLPVLVVALVKAGEVARLLG